MTRLRPRATPDSRLVLDARARELARPAAALIGENDAPAQDSVVVLEIGVGEERIGVPLAQIMEVFRPTEMSAVPGARPPVAGVMAWRGRVLTVLDLAHARPAAPALGDATRVIVVGEGRAAFGLLADHVDDVRAIAPGDLGAPDDSSLARAGIMRGVTPDALVVLDATALLQRHITST